MNQAIRQFTDGDTERLLEVWYEASLVAHPFLSPEFLAEERQRITALYLPAAETWVYDSGAVDGFMSLIGNELGAIFVAPDKHRTGIGRALLLHALTLRDYLEVEVFADNSIGRAFYLKNGFTLLGESVHPETGLSVLRLRRGQ